MCIDCERDELRERMYLSALALTLDVGLDMRFMLFSATRLIIEFLNSALKDKQIEEEQKL